jgi:hypothetical protein
MKPYGFKLRPIFSSQNQYKDETIWFKLRPIISFIVWLPEYSTLGLRGYVGSTEEVNSIPVYN